MKANQLRNEDIRMAKVWSNHHKRFGVDVRERVCMCDCEFVFSGIVTYGVGRILDFCTEERLFPYLKYNFVGKEGGNLRQPEFGSQFHPGPLHFLFSC